jgi:hypothetical protein
MRRACFWARVEVPAAAGGLAGGAGAEGEGLSAGLAGSSTFCGAGAFSETSGLDEGF